MKIPNHWTRIPLQQLVVAQKGKKPIKLSKNKFHECVPYLDISAIEKGIINHFADSYSTVLATENDIFIVADGSRSGLVCKGQNGAVGSTLICLTPLGINQIFLYFFLVSQYEYLNNNKTGSSIPHLDLNIFYSLEVPVPPLNEQAFIVEQLEKELDTNKTQIESAENDIVKLGEYKKSILEQAISGRLTKNINEQDSLKKENRLSESWPLKTIGELSTFIGSGITPKGGMSNYLIEGIPFLRSQNIYPGELRLDDVVFISKAMHERMKRSHVKPFDVLLNITGGSIGRAAIVPKDFGEANVNQHVCIIRVNKLILPSFLILFLNSPLGQDIIMNSQTGVNRQGLNYRQIRSIAVNCPPVMKQDEIINWVNEQLKQVELLERAHENKINNFKDMQKSIFQMAFLGALSESVMPKHDLADLMQIIDEERKIKLKQIRENRKKQLTFINQNFMSSKDPNVIKEFIKEFALKEFKNSATPLTDGEIKRIRENTQAGFKDFDYDDFSNLFLELVQEKIHEKDEEPFFIPVKYQGKVGFQINK